MKISAQKLTNLLNAGFPAIWIKTSEPERIASEVCPMVEGYSCLNWDLTLSNNPNDPITQLLEATENSIMFAFNYHWFLSKPGPIQALKNSLVEFSATSKCFAVISHMVQIPKELEKDFIVMELALPGEESIESTINQITSGLELKAPVNTAKVVAASKGLTQRELENIYSLSLVENKTIDPKTVNDFKEQTIAKTGFLSVLKSERKFDSIVGYSVVKDFILGTIDNPDAKGVILIGPPGCGKTSLAEAIVGETGKFGISVDMGKLFSKFVGETDKNIDYAIELISSIGNCLVLIDEMEKSFAGASSSGDGDSGTTRRALAKWLNFLQSRPKGVYIIATCNSFKGMPPEYLRPGRWDTSPFYMDLPNAEVRQEIISYYADKKSIKIKKTEAKALENYSGAELEAIVNIMAMTKKSFQDSLNFVIPIARTMPEDINQLRQWASKSTIPADSEQTKTLTRKLKID